MKEQKSAFYQFMESVRDRNTYFWEGTHGTNGDCLITMGVQRILKETACKVVDSPEVAEQILMNGGGVFRMFSPVPLRKLHTIGGNIRPCL
jgi:uncharacterized protein YggL (DUF469 family)